MSEKKMDFKPTESKCLNLPNIIEEFVAFNLIDDRDFRLQTILLISDFLDPKISDGHKI